MKNYILPNHKNIDDALFIELKKELGGHIMGKIPNTNITWMPCVEIAIQYKLKVPYLALNPSILATKSDELEERKLVAPFITEFTARWYNDKYDRLLSIWIRILLQDKLDLSVNAFGDIDHGVNAVFRLSKRTAFTKKI